MKLLLFQMCIWGLMVAMQRANFLFKTIKPRLLILNGDIIDGWAFSKGIFRHLMEVINEFFRLLKEGTKLSISQEIMMNFCVGIPIPRWEKYG